MALNNSLAPQTKSGNKLSDFLAKDGVKAKLLNSLGSEKAVALFTANITSAVASNPKLQECDYGTVISAGLMASALELPISPTLGFVHLVPFEDKKNNRVVATFILGYKGYIQLAIRSGIYRKINVEPVKEGELVYYNPFFDEIQLDKIEDDAIREKTPTVGYFAMFETKTGFTKNLYWSKKKMLAHADRYSKAFSLEATTGKFPKVSYADYEAGNYPPGDEWKYSSNWYQDFDGMAMKTCIRQLIGKWGLMSIDMQEVYAKDTENIIATDGEDFDLVSKYEAPAEEPPKEEKPAPKATAKKAKAAEPEQPPEPDDDDDFFGDNPFAEAVE